VIVVVVMLEGGYGVDARGYELAVKNSLRADEAVCQPAHLSELPSEDDDLQAVAVVDMDVHRRDDLLGVVVLQRGQAVAQRPGVMVVHDGHGAHGHDVIVELGVDEMVADQITQRFGTISDTAVFKEVVESLQEVRVDGYANSFDFAHEW
jgi:hypothetical protein